MNISYRYQINYDDTILRGQEEKRPWDLVEMILGFADPHKILLDIGCGTAKKMLPIAPMFKQLIGVEPNGAMLAQAQRYFSEKNIHNVIFLQGEARQLPVNTASVDVACAILSVHDPKEIFRVLKPGGWVITEDSTENDKAGLKQYFYDADQQPRGQYSYLPQDGMARLNAAMYQTLFTDVTVQQGAWDAYFSREALIYLLEQTPLIKHFSLEKDERQLDTAISHLMTEQGIRITHQRVLMLARKPE